MKEKGHLCAWDPPRAEEHMGRDEEPDIVRGDDLKVARGVGPLLVRGDLALGRGGRLVVGHSGAFGTWFALHGDAQRGV